MRSPCVGTVSSIGFVAVAPSTRRCIPFSASNTSMSESVPVIRTCPPMFSANTPGILAPLIAPTTSSIVVPSITTSVSLTSIACPSNTTGFVYAPVTTALSPSMYSL